MKGIQDNCYDVCGTVCKLYYDVTRYNVTSHCVRSNGYYIPPKLAKSPYSNKFQTKLNELFNNIVVNVAHTSLNMVAYTFPV